MVVDQLVATQSISLIFEFIGKHDGEATKSAVVDYMQNDVEDKYKLSRDTTRKLIDRMYSRGIIKISIPERPGLPHYLSVNEENQYNQLVKAYRATDDFVNKMEEPLTKMVNLVAAHLSTHSKLGQDDCYDCKMLRGLVSGFLDDYENLIDATLEVILMRAFETPIPHDDKGPLYDSIAHSKLKLHQQTMRLVGPPSLDLSFSNELNEYVNRYGISLDSILTQYKEIIKSCKILSAHEWIAEFDPKDLTYRVDYR